MGPYIQKYSSVIFKDVSTFANNTASSDFALSTGGGIYALSSNLSIVHSKIGKNAADMGSGLYVAQTTFVCKGDNVFTDNQNELIGTLLAINSLVYCEGNTTFMNNFATHGGAGVQISHSLATFNGTTVFLNNNSSGGLGGGALNAVNSNITFLEASIFRANSAEKTAGGGIYCNNCNVVFSGSSYFESNSAFLEGGIDLFFSNMTLLGDNIFVNNVADGADSGGIHADSSTILRCTLNRIVQTEGQPFMLLILSPVQIPVLIKHPQKLVNVS